MEPELLRWPGLKGPVFAGQPLSPLTTWKIGGPAEYLAVPADLEEVYALMRLAQDRGWPLFFLGRGSNVLIDDGGLPGLTLHLARSLQKLEVQGESLRAGAGVALPRLAKAAMQLGFAGFEFLAGIPGTVGAAVRLNAGAHGGNLAQVLRRVWVATPQLQLLEFQAAELGLGYRTSVLLNFPHWLVVEAEFALKTPAPPETVARAHAGATGVSPESPPRQSPELRQRLQEPGGGAAGGPTHPGGRLQGAPPGRGPGVPQTRQLHPECGPRHRGPG